MSLQRMLASSGGRLLARQTFSGDVSPGAVLYSVGAAGAGVAMLRLTGAPDTFRLTNGASAGTVQNIGGGLLFLGFANNRYLAWIINSGGTAHDVWESPDGISWTKRVGFSFTGGFASIQSVIWNGSEYIAYSTWGSDSSRFAYYASPDLINWTFFNSSNSAHRKAWETLFFNGAYYALTDGGGVARLGADGKTYAAAYTGGGSFYSSPNFNSMSVQSGRLYVLKFGHIAWSDNGTVWAEYSHNVSISGAYPHLQMCGTVDMVFKMDIFNNALTVHEAPHNTGVFTDVTSRYTALLANEVRALTMIRNGSMLHLVYSTLTQASSLRVFTFFGIAS